MFGLPLDQRPSELFQAGIALPALAIGCRGGSGLVRRITLCLLIDGVTHQAEFDLRDVYSPKVVDEIAQGSVNRPIPEITATTTEAKRTAAGPQLSRHCADNAFLLMDAATRVTVVVQEGLHREYSTIFPSPLRPAPGWKSLADGRRLGYDPRS